MAIPSSLDDLQAILDYYPVINTRGVNAGEVSSDDYYLTDEDWSSSNVYMRRMYLWKSDSLFAPNYNDWECAYETIYSANTVISGIDEIEKDRTNQVQWDNIKGEALFFRANTFFQIAVVWCPAYDATTARKDLGIPLRLTTNFNIASTRSNVEQTYNQIIRDLKMAIQFLPVEQVHPYRPGKAAAYGLMARVYLSMRKYNLAQLYADSCLKIDAELMDYNEIDPSITYPIPRYNIEVLFAARITTPSIHAAVDSNLLRTYDKNDLRKILFFKSNNDGSFKFRGSYAKSTSLFAGVATDEIYLIKAECEARNGNVSNAMHDLNTLLIKRWEKGTFTPYSAPDQKSALRLILLERRKELLMRGLRWMDLKRLNKEGYNIILRRKINDQVYTLAPNDLRYALPIPEDVIELSNMTQNPR